MDLEGAKENIQPLASGRNISLLEVALHAESEKKIQDELEAKRKEFEDEIARYNGDDPLELWYEYIFWVEQCFPKCGKESALSEVLKRCIQALETDERYKQDRRMIKLYIKFIDMQPNQQEYYNFVYNQGIGTMVADLYMCWAYCFEILDNFDRAKDIYEKGLAARAEPLQDLKQGYLQLLEIKAKRNIFSDFKSDAEFFAKMGERRMALTSLHGHSKKKAVGSIRTGVVVKSLVPGVVNQENQSIKANHQPQVDVFTGHQEPNHEVPSSSLTLKSLIDTVSNAQENIREPGPWSSAKKSNQPQKGLFSSKDSAAVFAICEDSSENTQLNIETDESYSGIQLPVDFSRKNEPQKEMFTKVLPPDASIENLACNTDVVYPKGLDDREFSFEEILACRYWKRHDSKTDRLNNSLSVLSHILTGIRIPKNFATKNESQDDSTPPESHVFEGSSNLVAMCRILSGAVAPHISYEELLRVKYVAKKKQEESINQNKTNRVLEDMDIDEESLTEEKSQEDGGKTFKNMNETCSTQIFNLFIKPQSISTPNARKKNWITMPRSSLALYNQPPREERMGECSMEGELLSAKEDPPITHDSQNLLDPNVGKQLSVILETTESNSTGSGGGQITNATTKSNCDTRFCSTIYQDMTQKRQTITDTLAATPRKSILKKPTVVPSNFDIFHDSMVASGSNNERKQDSPTSPLAAEEEGAVGIDRPNFTVQADNFQFARPSAVNITVFKDLDETAERTSPKFAIPLRPKEKFLLQDSMEHFKKPSAPFKVPLLEKTIDEGESLVPTRLSTSIVIYRDSVDGGAEANEPLFAAKIEEPFAIDQDSVFVDKSVVGEKKFESNKDSPVSSFLFCTNPRRAITSCDVDFFQSPTSTTRSLIKGSNESMFPTIPHVVEQQLLDNSITFPSMPEITTTVPINLKKLANQSAQTKSYQMIPPNFNESLTFSSIVKKDGSISQKQNMSPDPPSIFPKEKEGSHEMEMGCAPNLKLNESLTFNSLMMKTLQKTTLVDEKVQAGELWSKNNVKIKEEQPSISNNESFTFNSLMKKMGNLSKKDDLFLSPDPPKTIKANFTDSIKLSQEDVLLKMMNVSLTTGKQISMSANFMSPLKHSKSKQGSATVSNESMTFNSLMKKELSDTVAMSPGPSAALQDQSLFPNLMTELPSSTTHDMCVFSNKNRHLNTELASMNITPIKPMAPKVSKPVISSQNQVSSANANDIYKFENTLRILPQDEDLRKADSWYNHDLDMSANFNNQPRTNLELSTAELYVDDPFDAHLINFLLDRVDLVKYLNNFEACELADTIPPLEIGCSVHIVDETYNIRKLIGKGAFGKIFSAKTTSRRLHALKQLNPCNLWEYYICLEVKSRILEFNTELLSAFVDIENALVGRNASVFVLPYCKYGNLLNICNEYKRQTTRNLDEKVVMILSTQLLTMIDALHACQIIHADVKPDNIMLMGPIDQRNYDYPVLKLIDFGQAIDMKLFGANVEFKKALKTDGFTCTEMKENRPWTYQTDLYCLAATIHTILLGKYMVTQKNMAGYGVREKLPRYFQREIWDQLFAILLNIEDCKTMPNLQELKLVLKTSLANCESATYEAVRKFNLIVDGIESLDK